MRITSFLAALLAVFAGTTSLFPAESSTATGAINTLGIKLLAKTGDTNSNALLSPYSIQSALAMTYAGADGITREEMARVLDFPKDGAELNDSFVALKKEFDEALQSSGQSEPITLRVASRLFGQQGFEFKKPFLELVKNEYGAPVETLDFIKESPKATQTINDWVETQTQQRIRNLIPNGTLGKDTRLVLVNAIYFKAAWQKAFEKSATQPAAFEIPGTGKAEVPTMRLTSRIGYAKRDGYTAVTIPYGFGGDFQFLILLPDKANGLAALESKLTAGLLASCMALEDRKVSLCLPKFKMEPATLKLGDELQTLGMRSAFDIPKGSANFDLMASRTPTSYLCISQVFHKTFISIDENGTEAAAATVVVMVGKNVVMLEPPPVEVRVDHPFLFAIQHRPSGACLFLGRLNDPR